jgi:hypothetical protein
MSSLAPGYGAALPVSFGLSVSKNGFILYGRW